MPLDDIRDHVARAIADAVESQFGHRPETVKLEVPPGRELGDLAWPGALPLARVVHKPPRAIAAAVAEAARWPEHVIRAEVAGPGFLNLYLHRGKVLAALLAGERRTPQRNEKVVVEHTNINPNKAAHIGHLRNAVLGDILVRCLRHLGFPVEVQNYIDDTGVQVADVVVGILHLPEQELAAVLGVETARRDELIREVVVRIPLRSIPAPSTSDFDDLCWEIYPRVTARYDREPEFAERRTQVLHALEGGHGGLDLDEAVFTLGQAVISGRPYPERAVARLGAAVAEGNLRCHLATMARLGIAYDLLPHESDILQLGFWERAFELLRTTGAVRYENSGKDAGCWVMSLRESPVFADMEDPDKILVRSNGTVTYTAKDIAYQLWKLGLLTDAHGRRKDFGYRPFARWHRAGPAEPVTYGQDGDHVVVRTDSDPGARVEDGTFGAGSTVYNVIDVRQSYPQKVVREAVRLLGHPDSADRSIHFAYEMVALTPGAVRTIEELSGVGFGLSREEMAKAYVEMSGRRGIGVKADHFLDTLLTRAEDAVRERTAESADPADLGDRAQKIAVGALRYLMARQSRNRVLAFDFDEALAFEGDTGPYLQYSAVRARKVFEKLAERRGEGPGSAQEAQRLTHREIPDDLWDLVLAVGRRGEVIRQAVDSLEFSLLAQHAHQLAQSFHRLYHTHPVLPEEDPELRRLRRAVFTLFEREMRVVLEELLGVPIPNEM